MISSAQRLFFVTVSLLFSACAPDAHSDSPFTGKPVLTNWRVQLVKHAWHVVLRTGRGFDYEGVAVIKHSASGVYLEMRQSGAAQQIAMRDVASVSRDAFRVAVNERRAAYLPVDCESTASSCCAPDVSENCGSLIDVDPCDPSMSFCCYLRGGGSIPCNPPLQVIAGAGCEFDEACGDDGNGQALGVGYFVFLHHYCWYDFGDGVWSCYASDAQSSGAPPNLYVVGSWLRNSQGVQMECRPSGYNGRGFAYYWDPKNIGVGTFSFGASTPKFIGYPVSFPGTGGASIGPAKIQSQWYWFGIPTPFNRVGICDYAE